MRLTVFSAISSREFNSPFSCFEANASLWIVQRVRLTEEKCRILSSSIFADIILYIFVVNLSDKRHWLCAVGNTYCLMKLQNELFLLKDLSVTCCIMPSAVSSVLLLIVPFKWIVFNFDDPFVTKNNFSDSDKSQKNNHLNNFVWFLCFCCNLCDFIRSL